MTFTLNLEELAGLGLIDPSWVEPLNPAQESLNLVAEFIEQELVAGRQVFPPQKNIMRAFRVSFEQVKLVIVGQDPYPTPGDAVGLSFSVAPERSLLPRSLMNIFKELQSDLDVEQPSSGDLSPWVTQGVLLLNRVLTVRSGEAASHRGIGWEQVTEQALRALNGRQGKPLVAVLWGNDAIASKDFLSNAVVIESAHPSPLSASRGFFGSRPFSHVNKALADLGLDPINWALPSESALF